jgi:hypothetical protein
MPRIAVQLFGHLRTFNECAPALRKHLLDKYEADVFIHTWDKTDHEDLTWHGLNSSSNSSVVDDQVKNEIYSVYNPKSILIEKQNLFEESGFFGTSDKIKISLQGMKYMLYSQYMANRLRLEYEAEQKVEYDYVVVTRPDIFLHSDIDIIKYQDEFAYDNNTSIHFVNNPELRLVAGKYIQFPRKADLFYFSKSNVINSITSTFIEFDYFYKEIENILPPGVECPEIAFFESIFKKGVRPRLCHNHFTIQRFKQKLGRRSLPYIENNSGLYKFLKKLKNYSVIFFDKLIRGLPGPLRHLVLRFFLRLGNYAQYLKAQEKSEL